MVIVVTTLGYIVTFLGEDVTSMGKNVTDLVVKKKDPRRELKKHAATIHCSNTLSLLQRKISNALLYHAYHELMQKEEHEITVKQLCRLIGYNGNNHSAIKDALKELISTVIEWNLFDEVTGSENWSASSIIASVSLEGPLCYYAYSPRMKQLLHSPSMFGKIDLVIQSRFRSSYGLALYENCIRYRGLPQTKWLDMDLFKKLMGVPAGKYGVFRDFKRRVLDKAIAEVNTYSDLVIASEFFREGRKVTKIRFKLKERAKRTRLGNYLPLKHPEQEVLREKLLQGFGLNEEQVEQLLTEYDTAFIEEKITVIASSKAYQEGRILNLAAYLLSAIKHNYQPPKCVSKPIEVAPVEVIGAIELAALKRKVEQIRLDYNTYREHAIQQVIDALPEERKARFMADFFLFAEPVISMIVQLQRHTYTRENVMTSPQLQALLRQYALRELDLLTMTPFDSFVTQQPAESLAAWEKLKSYDPEHPLLYFKD